MSPTSPSQSTLPVLFTVAKVASSLNVSPRTVRWWIDAGTLRVHRLGRSIRVSEEDLCAFLKSHRGT